MRRFLCACAAMAVLGLASGVWANRAPVRPPPAASQPATRPATKPSKTMGFAIGGAAVSAVLLGSGVYLIRRR